MKTIIGACLVLVLLSGCSSVAYLKKENTDLRLPPIDKQFVEVYVTTHIDREYTEVGQVIANVDAGSNAETAVERLKAVAAEIGANGIIDLRLEIDYGYWTNAIKATGTAVKFPRQ